MARKKNKKHRFKVTCPIVLKPTFFVEATVPKLTELGALKKIRDLNIGTFLERIRESMEQVTMESLGEVIIEHDD